MTAIKAPHHHPRSGPSAARRVLFMLITAFATASALLVGSLDVAAQDATATPTQQELQQLRAEATAAGVPQLELTFEELNDSGVEGTVTLADVGEGRTLIAIAITGGGAAHPAHIHEGTCGNSEPEPYRSLTTVENSEESLSLVDVPLNDLVDGGDYTIDLHLSPSQLGTLVVCANIEGSPTPATAEATSAATTTATPEQTATAVATGEGGQPVTATQTPTAATTATAPATATQTQTPTATATAAATAVGGQGTTQTPTVVSGKGTAIDGTGGAQAAPGAVASLPLADYSGIGVTGTVSLVAIDARTTRVTIELQGAAVTGGHVAHLHRGTCDTLQSDGTIYLASVGADGVSSTTVNIPIEDLLNNGWSVNVHLSESEWNVWMVCGTFGDATGGMTGSTSVTPAPNSGKGVPVKPANVVTAADGTSGVGGKGEPVAPSTVPQGVGIGSTVPWPDSPAHAIAWSLGVFALMLAAAGFFVRRTDHRQPTRWHRLGL